jgi:hypothetical protein
LISEAMLRAPTVKSDPLGGSPEPIEVCDTLGTFGALDPWNPSDPHSASSTSHSPTPLWGLLRSVSQRSPRLRSPQRGAQSRLIQFTENNLHPPSRRRLNRVILNEPIQVSHDI